MEQQAHSDLAGLLALVESALRLKSIPRTGWLDRGIAAATAESVAEHSFAVALLGWITAVEREASGAAIRPERVLLLGLVHDLAEAETGDEPPYDPETLPDDLTDRREFLQRRHVRDAHRETTKRIAEDAAMRRLMSSLPPASRAAVAALWEELRAGTSEEARFVKQIDRLETFFQSRRYLAAQPGIPVASFEREVVETLVDPLLRELRDAALQEAPNEQD